MKNTQGGEKFEKKVSFLAALEALSVHFPERSGEIVRSRYGIGKAKMLTLEEIGNKYGVTRERIRQIIREICRKVSQIKDEEALAPVREAIRYEVSAHDGIMDEESLIAALGANDSKEAGAARFFLECLSDVKGVEIRGKLKYSYALNSFELKDWERVHAAARAVLEKEERPLEEAELVSKMVASLGKGVATEKSIRNFLGAAEDIKSNTFGKWGLSRWKEVTPKGTRERAYLILKEAKEPLHFREIAKRIDSFKLGKRATHPQTVHNELIKDDNFVLVGRGIYALSEWGYKTGTVKDVIEDILKKNPKGLSRDQVIEEVLKVRQVKKSTVVINLNNFFRKNAAGHYTLGK
ncbi:MAG TPA: HTH domain-containing protein [Candidatus Moranbacteria bacterium]|nr:HTH domain-containing protein [Candidatus Moranbacteria bacterium]